MRYENKIRGLKNEVSFNLKTEYRLQPYTLYLNLTFRLFSHRPV